MTVSTIADFSTLVGSTAIGEWFSVDAEHVVAFDTASYFPLDENYMDGYPEGLIEGFYLLALLDEFGSRLFPVDTDALIGWNYGLNRVRFVTPVHVGQPIRLSATVESVEQRDDAALVTITYRGELGGVDRPAFVAEHLTLWRPRS